jgi:hypothetical protein
VLAAWKKGQPLEPGALEGIITSTDVVDQLIGEHLEDADKEEDDALSGPAAGYKTFTTEDPRSLSPTDGESMSDENKKLEAHQSNLSNEVIKQSLLERAINKFTKPLRNRRGKPNTRRRPRGTPHGGATASPRTNAMKQPLLKKVSEAGEESKPQQGTAAAAAEESSEDDSPRGLHRENSDDGDVEDDDGSDDADSIDH